MKDDISDVDEEEGCGVSNWDLLVNLICPSFVDSQYKKKYLKVLGSLSLLKFNSTSSAILYLLSHLISSVSNTCSILCPLASSRNSCISLL